MITGHKLVEEYRKTIGKYTYDQRDCIGSIWKILERYGAKASIIGSNWFARHELKNMRPLTSRSQLFDGCAVLKSVNPGEGNYKLPSRYKNDDDPIDYNHIGIGTDKGEILDSTRYGQKPDGSWTRNGPGLSTAGINPNSWDIIGEFEDVIYVLKEEEMSQAIDFAVVQAAKGSSVRYRRNPDPKSIVVSNVPVNTRVPVLEKMDGWWKISYAGKIGWMMQQFLDGTDVASAGDSLVVAGVEYLTVIEQHANSILEMCRQIKDRSVQ